jgi:hypothetical protein
VYRSYCGEEYIGQFAAGARHGLGLLRSCDSSQLYEGEFQCGIAKGLGSLTGGSGGMYEGQFFKGMPHGTGLFVKKNGDTYMGTVQVLLYVNTVVYSHQ